MSGPVAVGGRPALNRIAPLRRSVWWHAVWLALGFTVLAAVVTWRAWTPNPLDRLWIGGADGDFLRQFYPYRAFVARAIASGYLPLWNPHQYAGTPALADPQLAVAYPWRLLQVPWAAGEGPLPIMSVTVEAVAHLALGAVGATALARAAGAAGWSACVAGLAFGLGGYLTGYPLDQLAVLESAAWIPVALWALVEATSPRSPRGRWQYGMAAGVASAMSLLAGHPQTAAFGVVGGLFYLAWRAAAHRLGPRIAERRQVDADASGPGSAPTTAWVGRVGALWLGLAVGLSAIQWIPTARLARHAARSLTTEEVLAGLPVADVLQVLAPHAATRWSPLYVGIVTVVFALWAGWMVPRARVWLAMAGSAWLWALGGNGLIVPVLYAWLPGLFIFRHQERAAVLVALGLAVAGALGLDRFTRSGARRHTAIGVFATVAVGLAMVALLGITGGPSPAWLAGSGGHWSWADAAAHGALWAAAAAAMLAVGLQRRVPPRVLTLGVAGLLALDLLSANTNHALGPVEGGQPYRTDPLVEELLPRARDGRISSEGLLPGGANAASVHGFYDVTGDSPLHLDSTARLIGGAPELVWWRLLSVRYVVSDRPVGEAEASLLREMVRDGERVLYEVQLPVPQVWTSAVTQCVEDDAGWSPDSGFDPRASVVIRAADITAASDHVPQDRPSCDDRPPAAGRVHPTMDGAATNLAEARLTGLSPGRATALVRLREAGWVVRSTSWDPGSGWKVAAVDDDGRVLRPRTIRAYGALPAVWLPSGDWTVQWTDRPATSILGAIVSVLTWSVVIVGTIWVRRQDRPGK